MSLMAEWGDHPQTAAIIKNPFTTNDNVLDMGWGKKLKGGSSEGHEDEEWKIL